MTVYTNIRIWDGTSDDLLVADAIEIVDDRIVAVGETSSFGDRADARDMGGAYALPGLIDAHVHLCLNPEIMKPEDQETAPEPLMAQMTERAERMLAAGITTARDLGGGQWLELDVRNRVAAGDIPGPRLVCSGQPITSIKGHCHFWGGEAADLDEAIGVIARQLEHDVDLIKVMATGGNLTAGSRPVDAQFDAETLSAIVAEAARNDCHVAAHCHGVDGIRNASLAGVTTIEHCSWAGAQGWARAYDDEVTAEIVKRGIWVSPTINLGWKRRLDNKDYVSLIQGNYERMRNAGVKFIASTDAGIPNVFHHDLAGALPVFSHFSGLSNLEVLKAATSDCATAIGLGSLTGRIAPGYAADILFVESNPLTDLAALASPIGVVARGRDYFSV